MKKECLKLSDERLIDKYRGCLIGGAVGDALGYPVEFKSENQIKHKYGEEGITEYDPVDGIAHISDDTQMTLYTANGILLGITRGMTRGIGGKPENYIALCYKDWYRTQTEEYPLDLPLNFAWISNIPELFSRRAPGQTCLSALSDFTAKGIRGSIDNPINKSKGCGGIMRVAPIGIYYDNKRGSIEYADMVAAESAAITHGHDLGNISAAALVHIIYRVAHDDSISLLEATKDMIVYMKKLFRNSKHIKDFVKLMKKAIKLSSLNIPDAEAIGMLGEGWVAEETLAIALYCSLKHENDFKKAVVAAVNHGGDSDSTGAVTGNILGARLGLSAIPKQYIDNLELRDLIIELADDLYHDCQIDEYKSSEDGIWEEKYIYRTYKFDRKATR